MENLQDVIRLGSKLDILYVEDDKVLLEETRDILEKIFHKVDVAESGGEGLLKFTLNHYDLVITDIEMPGLNGLEMSKRIKEIDPQMPVVIISAYSNSPYLIEAINIGINFYVLKPILLPQLLNTLGSVVTMVENRRVALACQRKEVSESIRVANEKLFYAMTKASPNPIVICDGPNVSFFNMAFEKLFTVKEIKSLKEKPTPLKQFLEKKIAVDRLFEKEELFVQELNFERIPDGEPLKLSLKAEVGTRIYLMIKSRLNLTKKRTTLMFTFNDITVLSFQRIQLKEYDKAIGKITTSQYQQNEVLEDNGIINKTSFEVE